MVKEVAQYAKHFIFFISFFVLSLIFSSVISRRESTFSMQINVPQMVEVGEEFTVSASITNNSIFIYTFSFSKNTNPILILLKTKDINDFYVFTHSQSGFCLPKSGFENERIFKFDTPGIYEIIILIDVKIGGKKFFSNNSYFVQVV